jgi:hypothetical protein
VILLELSGLALHFDSRVSGLSACCPASGFPCIYPPDLTGDLDFVDLLTISTSLAHYFSHLDIRFLGSYHISQQGSFKFKLTPRVLTSFLTTAQLLISYWLVGKLYVFAFALK